MFDTDVARECAFKFRDFRSHDKLAVIEHALDAGVDFGFVPLVLLFEINEFHC